MRNVFLSIAIALCSGRFSKVGLQRGRDRGSELEEESKFGVGLMAWLRRIGDHPWRVLS